MRTCHPAQRAHALPRTAEPPKQKNRACLWAVSESSRFRLSPDQSFSVPVTLCHAALDFLEQIRHVYRLGQELVVRKPTAVRRNSKIRGLRVQRTQDEDGHGLQFGCPANFLDG